MVCGFVNILNKIFENRQKSVNEITPTQNIVTPAFFFKSTQMSDISFCHWIWVTHLFLSSKYILSRVEI